jgi:hypothetical protein
MECFRHSGSIPQRMAAAQLPLRSVQPVPRETSLRLYTRSQRQPGLQRSAALQPVILSPVENDTDETVPVVTLAHLEGLKLRRAADGWHASEGRWRHLSSLASRRHAGCRHPLRRAVALGRHHGGSSARHLWRSVARPPPGLPFGEQPCQLRQLWNLGYLRGDIHGYRRVWIGLNHSHSIVPGGFEVTS